jgi:hypothetical protein
MFQKFIFILLFAVSSVMAQDLMKEQIRPLQKEKKSIYTTAGTFYTKPIKENAVLKKIRNAYVRTRGYERIVLDFDGKKPPQVYGHINGPKNKVFIDLFNTGLSSNVKQLKDVKFIKNVDFYTMDKDLTAKDIYKVGVVCKVVKKLKTT